MTIDRFILRYDNRGVIPPEYFSGSGKKNYIAHILGRDPKYTWKRQWVKRLVIMGSKLIRYPTESFIEGEIYEIHSSYITTPVTKTKTDEFDRKTWLMDKMKRINSEYNGFWRVEETIAYGIKMERVSMMEMNKIFPKKDDSGFEQTTLYDFSKGGFNIED